MDRTDDEIERLAAQGDLDKVVRLQQLMDLQLELNKASETIDALTEQVAELVEACDALRKGIESINDTLEGTQ